MWCALVVFSVSAALTGGGYQWILTTYVTPILALLLLVIGLGGFKANVIPFGVDRMEGASSDQISSYFYWYHWGVNVGAKQRTFTTSILEITAYYNYCVCDHSAQDSCNLPTSNF